MIVRIDPAVQIADAKFLEFIQTKAPFIYEVEGGQNPPLFSFVSTVIATQSEIDDGCISEVIYCASSLNADLENGWLDWIVSEYHSFMPSLGSEYQIARVKKNGNAENIRGLLVFRSEFEKPFLKEMFIVTLQENGLFKENFKLNKDACRTVLSFILHNDRGISRVSSDFNNRETLLSKDFFDGLDDLSGKNVVQLFESYECNRYGYICVDMECKLTQTDELVEISEIKKILIKKESYVLRWQERAPSTLRAFMEGKYTEAPVVDIPYHNGGIGHFHLWRN